MRSRFLFAALSILLGMLNVWAFAPTFYWWCSVISLSGFFILIRLATSLKQTLIISVFYFLGYSLLFIAWIDFPILRYFIILIAFWSAFLHTAWIGYLSGLARGLPITLHLLLFSLLWTSGEWLRGHLFTGIPWNLLSYIGLFNETWMQTGAWWGSYGLIIPIVFIFTTPALIIMQPRALSSWLVLLFSLTLLISGYIYGTQRLNRNPTIYWPNLTLRLVQTNFKVIDKAANQTKFILDSYIKQTFNDKPKGITAFIWPEAAINQYYINLTHPEFKAYNQFVSRIQKVLPMNSVLMTGLQRAEIEEKPTFRVHKTWHGLAVINQQGLVDWYTKHHLVPFAEYIPVLHSFGVPNLLSLVKDTQTKNYISGKGPTVLTVPRLPPFAPAICFESIFPQDIVPKNATPQPAWILVISNDAWYHDTPYPIWLLQMTRMRAIEQGLPLVRVANVGISAVFDGVGRTLVSLPINTFQNADVKLPRPLVSTTLYARYGDTVLAFMLMVGGCVLLIGIFVTRRASLRMGKA